MSTLQDLDLKSLEKDTPDTAYRRVNVVKSDFDFSWDSFTVSYPTSTQEIYTFLLGVTVVKTITLNYTDSTKEILSGGSKV